MIAVAMSGGGRLVGSCSITSRSGGRDRRTVDAAVESAPVSWRTEAPGKNLQNLKLLAPDGAVRSTTSGNARRVASHLGMPFYVLNLENQFEETVVAPFVASYIRGRRRARASCATTS